MTHTPRILVVDDDQPILLLMKSILKEFGFEPIVASTGSDALRQAAADAPELILLDMTMPEMSGAEFIQKLRSEPAMAGIPVLILSGHPVTESELERIGADGAIQKPFDLNALLRRIRHHLGSHQTGSI
jgi:DNA-binding response OmpR family regulator